MRKWCFGVSAAVLLAGCTTVAEKDNTPKGTPVMAAQIPGDLTYQDVLQEGEHVQSVAMSQASSRIWLGTNQGLYATASEEKLWTVASPDVATDDITGWFSDPMNQEHMYIVGNGFCKRSEDGGKTWKKIGVGFPSAEVRGFTGGRDGDQLVLFISVSSEEIYQSTDSGNHWKLWQPLNQEISAIEYDQHEKKLYAIAQDGLLTYTGGNWENEKVADAARIDSIAVSNQDHQLYVLTEQGIMVKQDGVWGPIEAKAPENVVMISSGSKDITLIAIGESSFIYMFADGKWKKWE